MRNRRTWITITINTNTSFMLVLTGLKMQRSYYVESKALKNNIFNYIIIINLLNIDKVQKL